LLVLTRSLFSLSYLSLLPAADIAEALSSSSTPDLSSATEGAKDAASDLKSKAKSVLRGSSAVPNSIATLADQNADVRNEASDYRDPAGAVQLDKASGGATRVFANFMEMFLVKCCRNCVCRLLVLMINQRMSLCVDVWGNQKRVGCVRYAVLLQAVQRVDNNHGLWRGVLQVCV